MRVAYEDRPVLEEKVVKDTGKHVSEVGRQPERFNKAAGKRKAREPADVWIGRDLEKPVERKSRKVSFYLGEYTEEASCSDRVDSPLNPSPMASQRVSAAAANAFNDDISVIDPPLLLGGFKNNCAPDVVVCDDGEKRQKSFSSRKPLENKAAGTSVGKEKVSSSSVKEKSVESIQGVPSDAQMACGFNFGNIGLLPASGETAAKFSEFCDLIGLEESKLAKANDYHLISGSFPSFDLT
ncbi:uncharacterized protein [Miscanthus floridulus]|uniref:uncharacterized protein n=1 Tax=Miscanthus floridulus TaxID=154761 RepID=UPI003459F931